LANFADDAKMSNDDLDALFDSVEAVTASEEPASESPAIEPAAAVQPQAPKSSKLDTMGDMDRLSNDDLDALFADPDSLLAEQAQEQGADAATQDTETSFDENDFNSAWDSVLTQAQDELAKIAENKIAKQKEREARKLENLRAKAKDDPKLEQLLQETEQSVFDDQDFANQWDQVLTEARTQLNQMVGGTKPAEKGNGGKLSNDDLTAQLDNLLAEVEAETQSSESFESLNDDQLSSALDTVLNQAKAELSRITEEKLKRHQETQAQKIQTIRESLSNDELASELDGLINHALEEHEAAQAAEADNQADDALAEMDFASAWDDVLGQAKTELSRLAKEKKQRLETFAQAREQAKQADTDQPAASQASAAAPTQANEDASVDLASELDALFADAVQAPGEPAADTNTDTAAKDADAKQTLDNEELASELEHLMSQAIQGATEPQAPADASPDASQPANVSADDIQELVDTSQPQSPQTDTQPAAADAGHDPAIDEPQDPSAMINHIDSLLAEHASEAVSDMFETPEKIAEHGLSDEDLEAAFQSPEQVLQNLQEASQNTSQAKEEQEQEAPAQAASPAAEPPQVQAAQVDEADEADDDLEGFFEAPDELNNQAAPMAAEHVEPAAELAEEALEVGHDDADDLMGDFESPEQAVQANAGQEAVAVEMAYEAADEVQPPQAEPAVAAQATDAIEDADEFTDPAEKKPSLITRLMAKLKPLGKLGSTLSVLLANLLKQLGPLLNKVCARINGPLLRLNKSSRDIIGYVGLVQLFFGVILFFVFFKKMLFGD
ncbi:MAG: hypothetical protein ACF8OB_14445, partial [Phycisphaeraceae bacterium JB051]